MASTYLTRTMSQNSNQRVFTLSVWLKRASLGRHVIMGVGGSGNYAMELYFQSGDQIDWWNYFNGSYAGRKVTNRKFRDTNAWYHIVARWDTTDSTAGNRMRLYVNGVEETSFSTDSDPSQNTTSEWNSASAHEIGRNGNSSYCFDGVMSHIHFVDGSSLAPSVFGSTDSTTGEWKINTSPSFTPGSNGFTILKDGNTITDQSANSNDFTLSAGTLTKSEDNPSNSFAIGNRLIGRHSNGNYLQPDWSNASLTANANGSAWRIFKSSLAASSGKYYAEFKWVSDSNTRYAYVGIYDEDDYARKASGYPYLNDMANGHAYYSENGNYYTNNTNTSFGSAFSSTGDGIVGVAMDLDNSKVYWSSNGSWQGGGDPSNGTGGKSITANKLYSFGLSLYSVGSIVYSANFGNGYFGTTAVSSAGTNASGNGIFEYDVPTGFTALSTKGLNL